MTGDASTAELHTYTILGLAGQPDGGRLRPEHLTVVHLHSRHRRAAQMWKVLTGASSDYLAVDRTGLSGDWLIRAGDLLEDPAVGAVVITGPECAYGQRLFAELGAATVVRVSALRELGGASIAFGDLSMEADILWRLVARGYRVVALPDAPNASYPAYVPTSSRLALLIANLELANLERVLPGLVLSIATEPLREAGVDTSALDLQRSPGNDSVGSISLPQPALSGSTDMVDLSDTMGMLHQSRIRSQGTRRLSDRILAGPISAYLSATVEQAGIPDDIRAVLPVELDPAPRLRTLIVATETPGRDDDLGRWVDAVASAISRVADVRYVAAIEDRAYHFADGNWHLLEGEASATIPSWPDSLVLEAIHLRAVPALVKAAVPILVDATHWDVFAEMRREHSGLTFREGDHGLFGHLFAESLRRSDILAARDEVQRDGLLGLLAGMKRLNDLVYDEDASLRSIVDLLDADGIAAWCEAPRRAIDQVRSFSPEEAGETESGNVLAKASRHVRGGLRRLRGSR